jgi:thioesterase domain-containing protein/acyl carrier protein
MSSSNPEPIYEQSVTQSALGEPTRATIAASTGTKATEAASADFWASIQTVMRLQQGLPALESSHREAPPLLSHAEERLWLLNEFQPDSAALTLPFTLRLRGTLHRDALESSLGEILRRHDVLRTNYRNIEGQALCTVNPVQPYRLAEVDLSEFAPSERDSKARALAIAAAQKSFNLGDEPLFRAQLLRLGAQEHWLLIAIHHIVFDGWSESILFQELAALYRSFATGEPSPLGDPPMIQYRDYGIWQRQCLTGDYRAALLAHWQQQLSDNLGSQARPIDRAPSTVANPRSQTEPFFIASSLVEKLKTFSRREKVTLFVTLLAGFKLLLYRYTGQESLYVCTPSANRTRPETKGLIGYFVNLLILQTDLSGEPSFRELLHRVRQVVSGAFAYQDLPVQVLLEEIEVQNIQLSQVMFALQNMPRQAPELWDLDVALLDIDNGAADFDLFLSLTEENGGLCGKLKYNADRFEASAIRQLVEHYEMLLSNGVEHPDSPLTSPQLLPAEIARRAPSAAGTAQSSRDYLEPRTEAERKLVEIWQPLLGVERIGVHDNFFELGGHSVLALKLFTQVKQQFGKELLLSTLFHAPTVEQLAALVQQEEAGQLPWSALVPIQPTGSRPPIFCIHGGGGNALNFHLLARHLDPEQPVYGLQSVGLDSKQEPLKRIEDMAAHYLREIRRVQPEGSYFLIGYSMGGVIAFEIAQQLYRAGQKVAMLAMFDTFGPRYYQPHTFFDELQRHRLNLSKLSLKGKLIYCLKRLRETGELYKLRFRNLMHSFFPSAKRLEEESLTVRSVWLANQQALAAYVPQVYPGDMILFRPEKQDWWSMPDPYLDWPRWIAGDIELLQVPGDHYTMVLEPNIAGVAEQLKVCMDERSLPEQAAASAAIASRLSDIWRRLLGLKQVGMRDNFFELGGHSMLALKLFNQIQQTFGKALPMSTLFQAPTIEKLTEVLQRNTETQADWSSLVPIQPEGTRPPIFCVHGIGGNIIDLYGLAHHLGTDQPFYGLQAVGLDGKQAPLQRIEDMAAHYLQEIQAMYPDGPYYLAGNSMGGVVAFEMAQQLAQQGRSVGLLAFLDTYGPEYYQPVSRQKVWRCHWENLLFLQGSQKAAYLVMLLKQIGWQLRDSLVGAATALRSGARTAGRPTLPGMALADQPAGAAAIAEIQTAHTQALRCYRPKPYRGRAILFRVKEQPWWTMRDRTLDWGRWIPNGLEVQDVPGNHNNLLQTQYSRRIASQLQNVLSELERGYDARNEA